MSVRRNARPKHGHGHGKNACLDQEGRFFNWTKLVSKQHFEFVQRKMLLMYLVLAATLFWNKLEPQLDFLHKFVLSELK